MGHVVFEATILYSCILQLPREADEVAALVVCEAVCVALLEVSDAYIR